MDIKIKNELAQLKSVQKNPRKSICKNHIKRTSKTSFMARWCYLLKQKLSQ